MNSPALPSGARAEITLRPRSRIIGLKEGSCHLTGNCLPMAAGTGHQQPVLHVHTHIFMHIRKKVKSVKSIIVIISNHFKSSLDMKMVVTVFLNLFIYLFIYFWLCWVFVSVRGLSPVAASGGHSSSLCAGLSLSRPLVVEHRLQTRRLSSCGSRAQLLRGMWDLPRPGLEPVCPALAGRFSTTVPPGKPMVTVLKGFVRQIF